MSGPAPAPAVGGQVDMLITGLIQGWTCALIALGPDLQHGNARIMNLANGEMPVAEATPRSRANPGRT